MATHDEKIDLAMAHLRAQSKPNVSRAAAEFGILESTLRRRYKGKTVSISAAKSLYFQRLSAPQEEALIAQINRLTERKIPPTNAMVQNLAEEVFGGPLGRNWVGQFCKRRGDVLTSRYLRNIDHQRVKSEYLPLYEQHFEQVWSPCLFSLFSCSFCSLLLNFLPSLALELKSTILPSKTFTIWTRKAFSLEWGVLQSVS